MFIFALVPIVVLLSGCSTLTADIEEGDKRTHLRVQTFFDAKSELAKAHTTSTDKTQSVSVSGLAQEASGSNVVSIAESIARGVAAGLKP